MKMRNAIHQQSIRPVGMVSIPFPMKVVMAGVSATSATLVTHPFDVVKVLMQIEGLKASESKKAPTISPLRSVVDIVKQRGAGVLYNGVTAAVMRQVFYGSARLAIFDYLMTAAEAKDGTPPTLNKKLVFSAIAGGIGAIIGNPVNRFFPRTLQGDIQKADMTLVRMAADSRLPREERRNYGNVFNALRRIQAEEGILAWWKGATPTITRAIVVNVSQLTTYAQTKQEILRRGYIKEDGFTCHLISSMVSRLVL